MALLSLVAQLMGVEEGHGYWWNRIPGFWAVFGFVGCVAIIFVSKAIGKLWLQKGEDYYDEP